MTSVSRETSAEPPDPPAGAETFFPADRWESARRYAGALATDGVVRGLIGPREVPRLWERHLLNSVVLADLVPHGASVADVGTGAGLPGLPLALARPDLRVTLVEPLLRRVRFLDEVVAELRLGEQVELVRSRAEQLHGVREFDVVTARAVAPLERLLEWCWPLVAPGGRLLALKGAGAAGELEGVQSWLSDCEARGDVAVLGEGRLSEPTWVVRVVASPERRVGWAGSSNAQESSGRPRPRRAGRDQRHRRRKS